ncbi:hypothetical protein ACXPWS_08080 [Mycobacterium sp. BMJ-28]
MADVMNSADRLVTAAPGLLGMNTQGARLVALAFIAALAASVTSDMRGVSSMALLWASVVVSALGVMGVLARGHADPMPWLLAAMTALTGPAACVVMFLALPGAPVNANQTNAFGASVAVCAFLCVRGRTAMAWLAMATMTVLFAVWAQRTGQGAVAGLLVVVPNAAVVGMSTLFALIMRPAAADITRLRDRAVQESREIAAVQARRTEGIARRDELRESTWPTMQAVAAGKAFSTAEAVEVDLLERQLRDSVRAKALAVPVVMAAARAARARGVKVALFDEGGFADGRSRFRADFCALAAQWLDNATDGVVTVRVQPPGRLSLGSIVAVSDGGVSRRVDMFTDGLLHHG